MPLRPSTPPADAPEKPVPVVVQPPSVLWRLPVLLEPLAIAGLVIVLVVFMLLPYGDLRSRLVRLVGSGPQQRDPARYAPEVISAEALTAEVLTLVE